MHAAGWEFNGGFTDRTFGETFEGWASQLAVGKLETTMRGEGRIALDLKETHGIDNGESYLKVFLNNDEIDKIWSGTRKTVVVSYKDGDWLSIQESYGKITLSSVTCPTVASRAPTCAEQAGRLSDLQSEAHMHAAGWEFNGGFTDRTFGETFEGWASQLAVGKLETTMRGEGRIALDLKETHGIDNGESYLKVFLNNDEIDKIGSGTRKTVVVSYKDGDLLSIQESYGKITLSSVTCTVPRN